MTIRIENLHHTYGNRVHALRGITLTIGEGECVLLLGQNGAGKSTFLKHLNGILKPSSGEVFIGETNTKTHDLAYLARFVAMSFQNPDDQIFSSTVLDETIFGPRNLRKEHSSELASKALRMLGLEDEKSSHPYDLHPTKRKLLSIASAIAMDTPIIAFDEPTAGFDLRQRRLFGEAIVNLKERKKTIFVVSHDLDYSIGFSDTIVLMDRGRVIFRGDRLQLFSRPDLRRLLKASGLGLPVLWRMSRSFGFGSPASSVEEFGERLNEL
jgi:energy-coupling factor transporter ATP-binding protein EcfA2